MVNKPEGTRILGQKESETPQSTRERLYIQTHIRVSLGAKPVDDSAVLLLTENEQRQQQARDNLALTE